MPHSRKPETIENEAQVEAAAAAFKAGTHKSIRAAARAFKVSKTTLTERIKGRPPRNKAHKELQLLTNAEEKELA